MNKLGEEVLNTLSKYRHYDQSWRCISGPFWCNSLRNCSIDLKQPLRKVKILMLSKSHDAE